MRTRYRAPASGERPRFVPGPPAGSIGNADDWERVGILFAVASIVATEDTLLFGFGFVGISTEAERNETSIPLVAAPPRLTRVHRTGCDRQATRGAHDRALRELVERANAA